MVFLYQNGTIYLVIQVNTTTDTPTLIFDNTTGNVLYNYYAALGAANAPVITLPALP